jgi:hypothetical protein
MIKDIRAFLFIFVLEKTKVFGSREKEKYWKLKLESPFGLGRCWCMLAFYPVAWDHEFETDMPTFTLYMMSTVVGRIIEIFFENIFLFWNV